jgi:hypothetical protein
MSTISASTTSTTAYKVTADTTGTLVLQTGSTPTTAVTIDASQNVGIGTSSPGAKLSLTSTGNTTADGVRLTFGSEARAHNIYSALATGRDLTIAPYRALTINTGSGTTEGVLTLNAYEYTVFGTGSSYTERMRLDASGNLSLSTSGASFSWLDSGSTYLSIGYIGSTNRIQGRAGAAASVPLTFWTNDTERARIDSSGNLLVATTNTDPAGSNVVGTAIGATGYVDVSRNGTTGYFNRISTDGSFIDLKKNGTTVGSISVSGSTTAYNTSSDYRLKNTITPMAGALAKVAALKPVTYKWNADGSDGEGFIAHELAAVVPQCVTGEKDAVETYTDEDGNEQTRPVYQGIDTSFLVATLTAAIQEQQAIIETLTNRISALENK